MIRPAFDDIYMELAVNLARRSHCIKRHVGVVLAKETRIISIGYNGPPSGTHNCDEEWPEVGCPRDSKGGCSLAIHAEQNAILTAARFGISVQDATIYTTMQPCFGCAKELLQAHVKRVVYMHPWAPSDVDPEMGIRKRAEYDKLTSRLDVRQIQMADPRAEWAVTTLRKKPDTN